MKSIGNIQKYFEKVKSRGITKPAYLVFHCERCKVAYTVEVCVCNSRFQCEYCRGKRFRRLWGKYVDVVKGFRFPALLTLTFKRSGDLWDDVKNFEKSIKKFVRSKGFKQMIRGYLFVIEVAQNNIHAHFIVDCVWWDWEKIRETWKRITGHSDVVDIRRVKNRKGALRYVLGYVLKGSDVDIELLENVFRGKRLVRSSLDIKAISRQNFSWVCGSCGCSIRCVGVAITGQNVSLVVDFLRWKGYECKELNFLNKNL